MSVNPLGKIWDRMCGGGSADALITSYGAWIIDHRRWVIASMLALGFIAAAGISQLEFSTDYRVYFSAENPELRAYDESQDTYAKEDNILFVLAPNEGGVFTPDFLNSVRELTAEAWKIPYATRVDSITNFQHSEADGDDIVVRDLVRATGDISRDAADQAGRIALGEPLIAGRLVSRDGLATGINVNLTLPQKSLDEVPRAMAHARGLVDGFRARHPGVRVALTGGVALNHAFVEASQSDLTNLIPVMYLVVILGVWLFLRSFAAMAATLTMVALSTATAMGLAGWLGYLVNPASAVAPIIITTIAIADSIHVLVTMLHEMRRGMSRHAAIIEALRINFQPVFLTSVTTMIGFLSLNASDSPPFHDLGNISAMGVAAAWLFTIVLLPALLAVLPVGAGRAAAPGGAAMAWLAERVIARRRLLLWGMAAISLALAAGIPRIELNDQFVNYFDRSIAFRTDTDFAMDRLSGIYTLEFSLDSGEPGGINEPDFMKILDGFAIWLRTRPGVVHVHSLGDVLKRLNRNMHGDDAEFYRLPERRKLAAQYLLLYEMSLPMGQDLKNQISLDKSATRVVATLENVTTAEARVLEGEAEAWLARHLPAARPVQATGPLMLFAYISERNIHAMLSGTGLALVLISLCLVAALRNVRLGLISLVPNATPAIIAFGVWGFTVGQIGLSASVVTAVTLGIIVDNTVHFLSKYQRARREQGASPEDAIRYAFATVGAALWVTSAILIAGFAVLALSAFQVNQVLGLMTALIVVVALATDFLLLPALLIAIDRAGRTARDGQLARLARTSEPPLADH